MIKKYDVFGMGNALVDSVCLVTEKFLKDNDIEKGLMTLVDDKKQISIIEKIQGSEPFIQSGGSVLIAVIAICSSTPRPRKVSTASAHSGQSSSRCQCLQ